MISWPQFSAQFCPRCPAQAAVANWRLQDRSVCDGDGVSVMGHGYRVYFCLSGHGNSRKSDFLGKALRIRKFSTGKFLGASAHGILTHSGFRKYSRFG